MSHARPGRKSEWPRIQLRSCLWIFEGNKPLHEMAATRWSEIASSIPIGRWVATTSHRSVGGHDFPPAPLWIFEGNKPRHENGGDSMESDCVFKPHRSVGQSVGRSVGHDFSPLCVCIVIVFAAWHMSEDMSARRVAAIGVNWRDWW